MDESGLRHSPRALVVDPDDRVLLFRAVLVDHGNFTVWVAPGGGVEPGESVRDGLSRELTEEIGLRLADDPPHVWRQTTVIDPDHFLGFGGVVNDFFLVRTAAFVPVGSHTPEQLVAEGMYEHRWWSVDEILANEREDIFGPRDLGRLLAVLLRDGPGAMPLQIGL